VNILLEVLTIYETALVPDEQREHDFHPVLSAALDPLVGQCMQIAAAMDPGDAPVMLINAFSFMQAPLRKYVFTVRRVELYASLIEEQMKLLVDRQAEALLTRLGMSERIQAIRDRPPGTSLQSIPCLEPMALSQCLRSFYTALFTLGTLALPQIEKIAVRNLRSEARTGVAHKVDEAYAELYEQIQELGVATHTPEQVRALLEL